MFGRFFMLPTRQTTAAPSQQEWTTPGEYSFVVPANVWDLAGVVIGPGTNRLGGGLHWRNGILVTPGETLTILVGLSDLSSVSLQSAVKRGSDYLLRADSDITFKDALGGGGGGGGVGLYLSASGGAGGAGGYMGRGGSGGNPGWNPDPNSGGGRGGDPFNDGGGVGLLGRAPDFAPGSLGSPKCGGGIGEGSLGGNGGVRLMWGTGGRSYPDNAANV